MVVRRRFFFASLISMTHIVMEKWSDGKSAPISNFNSTTSPNSTNSLDSGHWLLDCPVLADI